MAFPNLTPTAREYESGNYPVKAFKSQSGVETRILYGDARTGMQLKLTYDNISDAQSEQFLTHFEEVKGTFNTFTLPAATLTGWEGSTAGLDASGLNRWRYDGPPSVSNVRPGLSSVRVSLLGVL